MVLAMRDVLARRQLLSVPDMEHYIDLVLLFAGDHYGPDSVFVVDFPPGTTDAACEAIKQKYQAVGWSVGWTRRQYNLRLILYSGDVMLSIDYEEGVDDAVQPTDD